MAVAKANYVKRGRGTKARAKATIRYIQHRPRKEGERLAIHQFPVAILYVAHNRVFDPQYLVENVELIDGKGRAGNMQAFRAGRGS